MPILVDPQWQQMAMYAVGGAAVLVLLFNIPHVGPAIRALFSFGLLAFCLFVLIQQSPFDPKLSQIASRLGLDGQQVSGEDVRVRMSPDGHFWVRASINGVERRMLIDSGATVSALSVDTARLAGVDGSKGLFPVLMRTANGTVAAETGSVDRLTVGGIEARNLKVVIAPSLGSVNILGMNFLSQLGSWRVEGKTLILVPKREGEAQPD